MIADDDPDVRLALSVRLRADSFDTMSVCDGYSALAMALRETPHLIILDLGLPAGDGFAILKHVKDYPALSRFRGSRSSFLRAARSGDNERRSLESGAIAFSQKPHDEVELIRVIRATLRSAWGRGSLPS